MVLSEMGIIAYQEWQHTPEIRNNIELDAFIVMPNNCHKKDKRITKYKWICSLATELLGTHNPG